jgi:hypothetical protein
MPNNNSIRKFKVGSLYRNNAYPSSLYICIADVEWQGNHKSRFTKKSLVVLEDRSSFNCKGHIVASNAVKNWQWREV